MLVSFKIALFEHVLKAAPAKTIFRGIISQWLKSVGFQHPLALWLNLIDCNYRIGSPKCLYQSVRSVFFDNCTFSFLLKHFSEAR